MTNKVEWFWNRKHDEGNPLGTFESREKAIEDAKDLLEKGSVIEVGKVKRVKPESYLPDLDGIVEGMESLAFDNDFGWLDDELIDVKPGAEEALREILLKWSREYLSISYWINDDPDAETVILD